MAWRSVATRSCSPPIARRRWAAGRWSSASPRAIPNVTTRDAPGRHAGAWAELARQLRLGLDYLRFLDPRYAETPHLRQRARERAPRLVVRLAESRAGRAGWRPARADVAPAAPRARPAGRARRCEQFLAEQQPDVVLITPLVDIGSPQLDHFAAAQRARRPHGAAGRQLGSPVEQGAAARGARPRARLERDAAAARRSSCTACPPIASWSPARSATTSGSIGRRRAAAQAFCARVGLRSRSAVRAVRLLVALPRHRRRAGVRRALDPARCATSADPRLKDIGILIRPHPARLDEWRGVDLSGLPERGVLGRAPGRRRGEGRLLRLDVLQRRRRRHQHERVHRGGGRRQAGPHGAAAGDLARQPGRHAALPLPADGQRRAAARGALARRARARCWPTRWPAEGGGDEKAARFVEGFVRPFGRAEAATPRFVDAIEEVGRRCRAPAPRAPRRPAAWLACLALYPAGRACWRCTCGRSRGASARATGCARSASASARWRCDASSSSPSTTWARPGKQRKSATAGRRVGPDAEDRAPARSRQDAGRHRPARGARDARAGHGARPQRPADHPRPVAVGDRLRAALLDSVPGVGQGLRQLRSRSRLVVVSRGGAAPWYRHITPQLRGDLLVLHARRVPRRGTSERIVEQEGRQKHLEISVVRSRDPRSRASASAG